VSTTVRAAAKINLHLGVGATREDGFHPLDTVYQAISLYDDVTVSDAETDSLSVVGSPHVDVAGVPTDATNIAVRALSLASCDSRHHVQIAKQIPVAGGMAGGSADAAAALLAHDRLHDLGQADDELLEQAARLGSDEPFSLVGGVERPQPVERDEGRGGVGRAARHPAGDRDHLVYGECDVGRAIGAAGE
jgi:4-diphosphocytidyl-2-C-methyl-D-erythritol kinase